ncbi:MAG TPA: Gfo/Idh/MocA family oxidoreductase [Armatimonadota bacterium]|jgi:predicted dehydrogenase
MSRIINFGIVGCGVISGTHADALKANPDVASLVACCDILPDRAQALATKFGCKPYNSLEAMLEHEGLDCVCVCTPSGIHHQGVIGAAKKGINAIVEKPMDITREKLDAIAEVPAKYGVKVGCIFQRRAMDVINQVRDAVQGGELGTLFLAEANMKWFRSQEYYDSGEWRGTYALDGGGALMNQGIHGVDLIYYLMGPIASVKAYQATLTHKIEVEDNLTAAIKFKNGAIGNLTVSTSCVPGYSMVHNVHGSKGSISISDDQIVEWYIEGDEANRITGGKGDMQGAIDPRLLSSGGHTRLIRDMAEAIRDDRDPMITPDLGRTAVDLILAIYESARTGKEVLMP